MKSKTGPIKSKGTKASAGAKPISPSSNKGRTSSSNSKEGRIVGPPVATAKGLKATVTKNGWLANKSKYA